MMISKHTLYIFVGYAIIQLPEMLLLLYKQLMNIKYFISSKKRISTDVKPKPSAENSSSRDIEELKMQMQLVFTRLTRMEHDNMSINSIQ